MKGPPKDFALLIGKRLASKKAAGESAPDGAPGEEEEGPADGEDKEHEMKLSAMNDFISAVHAKSPTLAASSLEDFIEMCEGKEEEGEEEGEPPPPPEE